MVNASEILSALAGTYFLVNTSSFFQGTPVPDVSYGEAPVGLLTYTASGFMSATITATEPEFRPENLTFPFLPNQTNEDWALVGKHSIGYAGPLRVNDALPANKTHGQVFHGPLIVANVPSMANATQRRNYTVVDRGNATYLRIGSERGGGFTGELWWKKLD
ncbi:Lipocalin-like domain-containing protein [Dendryphion nanum]|uniref:Lipocalin-like domain-containing protein n=1 Tax=Dendryphion nanum TaxID=256645 RepID=A0A9P9EIW8_9PLEO|nr:Lipocalin-like domain-containing protein [Dendryphion nanum]